MFMQMPPHRGQGLNNGLQDAATLVEQLGAVSKAGKTLLEAVQAYEENMKERAKEELSISVRQARMVHNFDTLMNAPFIKLGMHKQKEAEALEKAKQEAQGIATAT